MVEEIIVTDRKREEALVDVPSSLTVIGAEQLSAYDTERLYELANSVPNMYVDQTNSGKRISIRGLGNTAVSTFIDSESLGMLNATVALKGRDDRWELRLIGRKLADEDVLIHHQSSAFPASWIGAIVPPRRFQGQLTVNFWGVGPYSWCIGPAR